MEFTHRYFRVLLFIMKKIITSILFVSSFLLLAACDMQSNAGDDAPTTINTLDLDYESLKSNYGDFSITVNGSEIPPVNNTYYLPVGSSSLTYIATGYFEGRIVIENSNNISSYKAVTILLKNACLVSDNEATISYTLTSKKISIVSEINSTNYVINKSTTNTEGHAISSNDDIDFYGTGLINLYAAHGHTIKSDGDFEISGTGSVYIYSGHDGVHCHNFSATKYSGNFTIANAISQGIEASVTSGTATLKISGGNFDISNAESMFKVDRAITISGGTVIGNNFSANAFVRGNEKTELSITISGTGSLTVNGTSYTGTTTV